MKAFVPGPGFLRFMDWTVKLTTVSEPDRLPVRYDYWFAGLVTGFLLGAVFL